jgi:signal transduction histidine kinase
MATTKQDQEEVQPNSSASDRFVSNIKWFWLLLTAFFILGDRFLAQEPAANFWVLLGAVGAGFLLNLVVTILLSLKRFPSGLDIAAAIFDVLLAIAVLVILSSYSQWLLPLLLFPVLLAAARWSLEAALGAAAPIILAHGVLLLPVLNGQSTQPMNSVLFAIGINALTLLIAGLLPGLFIKQRIEAIQQATEAELEAMRTANEHGDLISQLALTLSSTTDYHKVLQTAIELAFGAMTDPEEEARARTTVGMVLLFAEEEGQLNIAAGRGLSRFDEGRTVKADAGIIGETLQNAEVIINHQAAKDEALARLSSTKGCKSAICAPLRAGLHTYGVVLFCSKKAKFFHQNHKKLLTTFCSQAIIPIQNAQLLEELRYEQHRILEKEEEARRKLARDLHDGPTQSISAIAMRLNYLKMVVKNKDLARAYSELEKLEELARSTTQEVRTMLFAMRPVILETQGLLAALNQYAERLNTHGPFKMVINNKGYDNQLTKEAAGTIFAIIEEAVGNAKKHSQATELRLNLTVKKNTLYVEIKDNGVGFDVEATKSTYDQRTSLGLINMDERAQAIGGHATLTSTLGKGTTVSIEVPFTKQILAEAGQSS